MKNITDRLFSFLIPALFAFPLFKENISSILFVLIAATTLINSIFTKNYRNFDPRVLYLTIPFWIVLLSGLMRYNGPGSLAPVSKALFFLLFPIVFSQIPTHYFSSKKMELYFDILKYSCFAMAIGYLVSFLYVYGFSGFFRYTYSTPKFRDFVYYEIPFFRIHPTYYTSMLVFCTAVCFDRILTQKKYSEMIFIGLFFLISFLLLAKINIVFMVVLLGVMVLRTRFSFRQKVIATAGLLGLTAILAFTVPGIQKRFAEIYNSYSHPPAGLAYDSTNVRVAIYTCDLALIRENYWSGVGFDRLEGELYRCFEGNYDSDFFKKNSYLTHNYFCYMLISAGLAGLLAFLFYAYKVWQLVLKINQFYLYVAMVNIFLICLTEDFFYRHYGLLFFSLLLMGFARHSQAILARAPEPGQTLV